MKSLDEIKARLAKATPGPWVSDSSGFVEATTGAVCQTWDKLEEDFPNHKDNGEFIANAPTDIERLIKALEKAIEQRDAEIDLLTSEGFHSTDGKAGHNQEIETILGGGA